MVDTDRQAGVLTKRQRQYLAGELTDEIERQSQAERDMRRRIRRRIHNAVLDLGFLVEHLEPRDLRQTSDSFDYAELTTEGPAAVAFLYQLLEAGEHPIDAESVIEDGVSQGKSGRLEVLRQRFASDPESLTLGEINTLRERGQIPREEYQRHLRDALDDPIGGMLGGDALSRLLAADAESGDPLVEQLERTIASHEAVVDVTILPEGVVIESEDDEIEDIEANSISVTVTDEADVDTVADELVRLVDAVVEESVEPQHLDVRPVSEVSGVDAGEE